MRRRRQDGCCRRTYRCRRAPSMGVRGILLLPLLHVRVLRARVREQRVAARVHGRAERTGVIPGEVHVIVIAHIGYDLTAQRTPSPLVRATLSLKYL